jgi:hypothetical protein
MASEKLHRACPGEHEEGNSHPLPEIITLPREELGDNEIQLPVRGGYSGLRLSDVLRSVKSCRLRSHVVRTVIHCSGADQLHQLFVKYSEGLLKYLVINYFYLFKLTVIFRSGFGPPYTFVAIVSHPKPGFEHLHVWHDCTYSNYYCRCALFKDERRTRDPRKQKENGPYIVTRDTRNGNGYRPVPSTTLQTEDSKFFERVIK